jgi:DNA-binding CsgD family transcriptional regulator
VTERIIGREAELASAERFLDVASNRAGVLELVGDPGIGKTIVWRSALERARTRGFTLLSCRPAETETKIALSAIADLLEPIPPEVIDSLPEPQGRALRSATRADGGDSPPEPGTLGTAVRSTLGALAQRGTVVVAIDDVQWLDRASATVLAFALRRLGEAPVAWLLATRPVAVSPLGTHRLEDRVDRITLGPLSLAALHHIIESRLEQPLTRSTLVRAHDTSGGNPFYAIEIARELLNSGSSSPAGATPVPRDLRELLSKRLRRLPAETREALLIASAMSDPTTATVDEAALAAAEREDIVRVLDDGRVAFGHPLFAAAVQDAASRSERRHVHERLASLSSDAEERARHLALAATAPNEDLASTIEAGAERARSRGSWESAGELLEWARDLTPPDQAVDIARRTLLAAEHYVHAGERSRGRALVEPLLAGTLSRAMRAHALRLLGEISINDESYSEAHRLFEEAAAYADDGDVGTEIELGRAYLATFNADYEGARAHAHKAVELAEGTGNTALLAEGLAFSVMYDFLAGHEADWSKLARAVTLHDPTRMVPMWSQPSVVDAYLQNFHGRHAEARERMAALRNRAVETGDESDLAFLQLWSSWLETRCGNYDKAIELADEATRTARLTGSRSMEAWSQMQRAYVGAHVGEVEETRAASALGMERLDWVGGGMLMLWIAGASALLEVSLGNAEAAWNVCMPLVTLVESQGIAETIPFFFFPDAVEALIALGDLDRAEHVLDMFEDAATRRDRIWALATGGRCRALLRAARGDLDGALEAAEEALRQHRRIDLPFDRARALLVKGVIERRQRKRAKAKASFEMALEAFEQLGAPLWIERARAELGRLGLRRSSGDELTEAERRVAELTARGMTRREVAAALFISPKTVDAALMRVYRKLGVSSRAELGARMARSSQA